MVLVVTHNFAKVKLRVRFSLPAPTNLDNNLKKDVDKTVKIC